MSQGADRSRKAGRIVILGALSAIAEATARLYAARGAELVLVARNEIRLQELAHDLEARGASGCETLVADLASLEDKQALFDRAWGEGAEAVFLFYGTLGEQSEAQADIARARELIEVNFTSAAQWCLIAANRLEARDRGVLVAISSVAGDRGRQSNYVYGAAKAGLSTLVQGIAHRLAPTGARAVVAKLGFVDTPMTAHMQKGGPLWSQPEDVAEKLVRLADRPRAPIVYVPWFWRLIMLVIRTIPAFVFHRTRL